MENTLTEIIDKDVFFYLSSTLPPNILSYDHIHSVFFLGFDDNIGQLIEKYYTTQNLTPNIFDEVLSIGFPETTQLIGEGEETYIFSLRKNTSSLLSNVSISDQQFYYCYTKVAKVKCEKVKRGYIQKSIVIIGDNYNPKYYIPFLDEIYSLFFENHYTPLKEDEISKYIHNNNTKIEKQLYTPYIINSFFNTLSLYYIIKISSLWEIIITETPLLIVGDSPSKISDIVMIAESLIYPLRCKCDIRPYFSLYDIDFRQYKDNSMLIKTNTPIFGIINPLLAKDFNSLETLHFDDMFYTELKKTNPTKEKVFKSYEKVIKKEKKYLYVNKNYSTLHPDKQLIQSFYDYLTENNNDMSRLDNYLRMYLIELNNNFMKTFDNFFFTHCKEEITKISFLKQHFSIYEIFNEKKFFKYIETVSNVFNDKYVHNIERTSKLYAKFIKTKIFNDYLNHIHQKIKQMNN